MSVDDFAVFSKGTICSQFIDSVPMPEIARAASQVEIKLSVLLERRSEWEANFVAKYGIELGEVGLVKMIASLCVMAQCDVDVASLTFTTSALHSGGLCHLPLGLRLGLGTDLR